MDEQTVNARIANLEMVVGTLISWLTYNGLRRDESEALLKVLKPGVEDLHYETKLGLIESGALAAKQAERSEP